VYDESAMAGGNFAVSMNRANNTINSLTISGNTGFTFTPNVIDLKLGGPVTVSGGIHTFDNKGVYNMTVTANTTWDIAADSRLIWKINLSEASAGLGITKTGDGQLIMRGGMTNSITGDLAINGGSFGGAATLNGNLGFAAGTKLIFNDSYTLTMANGTASFDSFDIADLVNLDSSVSNATYTLISGNVDSTNIGNIGLDNAADIGAGKSAYFLENGGLQLVVIPEPATLSMLTFATLGLLAVRRLRK
jgi:autotransporter-associated beta strand protein